MKDRENEVWGAYTEWVGRLAFGLTKDRSTFHDARDSDGDPVEIKSCRVSTGRRGDHGKFFIRRENHDKLADAGGYYVFVLYEPQAWERGPVLDVAMKPAEWLGGVDGYTWTANGGRRGEVVKRPTWPNVFPDVAIGSG